MEEIEQDVTNCLAALAAFVSLLRQAGGELTEAQEAYLVKAEEAAQRALRLGLRCAESGD
jgi:hypothetical protein